VVGLAVVKGQKERGAADSGRILQLVWVYREETVLLQNADMFAEKFWGDSVVADAVPRR
jgi:hypothetical protein